MASQLAKVCNLYVSGHLKLNIQTSVAAQTLGEEYTDVWQYSSRLRRFPSRPLRVALVILPSLPAYLLVKFNSRIPSGSFLRNVPALIETLSEINLAIFYLRGTYQDIVKRFLGIRYVSRCSCIEDHQGAYG
jgi:peroxin-10